MSVQVPRDQTHVLKWLEILPARYSKIRWKMANHAPLSDEWRTSLLADAEIFLRAYLTAPGEEMALFTNLNNAKIDKAFESGRKPERTDYATERDVKAARSTQ